MSKRAKLILLLILMIAIVIFFIWFPYRNKKRSEPSYYKENTGTVYNQGKNILEYGNNIYLIDEDTNSIIKYNVKDKSSNVLMKMVDHRLGDHIYIINNQLIYIVDGNTYYTDIDNIKSKKFTDGRIVYIDDDIYMFIDKEYDSMEHLHICSYDNRTFENTIDVACELANGYKINYLRKCGDVLLFSSVNSDESTSLFSVDLKNSQTSFITRDTSFTAPTTRGEITDAIQDSENVYYIVSEYDKITDGEVFSNNYLFAKPIDKLFSEFSTEGIYSSLYLNKDSNLLFAQYNPDDEKYEINNYQFMDETYDLLEVAYEDVTKFFNIENSKVYANGEEFSSLDENYSSYDIKSVLHYNNYFYFLLENGSTHAWLYCDKDGGELSLIYKFN